MYSTSTGIKKSFYSQTGNFQFQADLLVDSLLGGVNLGVSGLKSGNIPTVINYFCNSGKIFDNNNKFVGAYTPDETFSISGNIKSGRYDYFINNNPISYNNYKDTGTYNYFYINPNYISCDYDLYINGEQPNLSVTNITCFTGDYAGTGYIINNRLPLIIYSGEYSNFSTNLSFGYSDIFTGQLNIGESGAFYIYPTSESAGLYTGKMNLFTNGGTLFHNTVINITESPVNTNDYNFNLNGLDYIIQNNTQLYTSDVEALFGSGIPIVVSLEYYSGSGNFYTNIDIISGFSRQISGYIFNSGYLISGNSVTGIGTGSGGYLNNTATGFVSGYFSGNLQYATGSFTWPYSLNVTGYRTGINYSGIATGFHNMIVSRTINSGSGTYNYNGLLTGNSTQNLYNVSGTGFIYPTGKIYYGFPQPSDLVSITAVNPGFPSMSNAYYDSTYYTIDELVDYINASNIATGFKDTPNTIMITGLYPDSITQQTLLTIDPFNAGTMTVSDYYLVGSVDLGVGQSVFSDNLPVTGYIANYKFTGSGVYYQNISGYISGSGNIIDYAKTFTGSWNLFTGQGEDQVNYYSGGLYNIEKNKYLDTDHPVYYTDSTAIINVEYINPYDSLSDIAILKVSGLNLNTGISLYITGLAVYG